MTDKEFKGWKVGDLVISRIIGSSHGAGIIVAVDKWAPGWITIQWSRWGNRENWSTGISCDRNLKVIKRLG